MKKDILDSDEFHELVRESILANSNWAPIVLEKIKEFIRNNYTPRNTPTIEIDKDAIRFYFKNSGENFFFEDLFTGNSQPNWQTKVMRAIKKAYDEYIKSDICNESDDDDD